MTLVCTVSSVCPFYIVAKQYVLAKNCLKERIGNHGQKVDFGGRCHISTSSFASTATETAVSALFLPIQTGDCTRNGLSSSKPCAYCRIVQ